MKKVLSMLLVLLMMCSAISAVAEPANPVPIKVLILPKFEVGELAGDFPGEAQYYYEAYCQGGDEYEVKGGFADNKLYVKDGVALYVTGMGKVNTALSLNAVLTDERFDFQMRTFSAPAVQVLLMNMASWEMYLSLPLQWTMIWDIMLMYANFRKEASPRGSMTLAMTVLLIKSLIRI